jgi:hypothetical protein
MINPTTFVPPLEANGTEFALVRKAGCFPQRYDRLEQALRGQLS